MTFTIVCYHISNKHFIIHLENTWTLPFRISHIFTFTCWCSREITFYLLILTHLFKIGFWTLSFIFSFSQIFTYIVLHSRRCSMPPVTPWKIPKLALDLLTFSQVFKNGHILHRRDWKFKATFYVPTHPCKLVYTYASINDLTKISLVGIDAFKLRLCVCTRLPRLSDEIMFWEVTEKKQKGRCSLALPNHR